MFWIFEVLCGVAQELNVVDINRQTEHKKKIKEKARENCQMYGEFSTIRLLFVLFCLINSCPDSRCSLSQQPCMNTRMNLISHHSKREPQISSFDSPQGRVQVGRGGPLTRLPNQGQRASLFWAGTLGEAGGGGSAR